MRGVGVLGPRGVANGPSRRRDPPLPPSRLSNTSQLCLIGGVGHHEQDRPLSLGAPIIRRLEKEPVMANDNNNPTDPWCSPAQMENGEIVVGAAAREYRIKRQGGLPAIISDAANKAAAAAVAAALAAYQAEQT